MADDNKKIETWQKIDASFVIFWLIMIEFLIRHQYAVWTQDQRYPRWVDTIPIFTYMILDTIRKSGWTKYLKTVYRTKISVFDLILIISYASVKIANLWE